MKWSTVTVGVMILGIIGVSIILLFQQLTTTNENDYYLLKEITIFAFYKTTLVQQFTESHCLENEIMKLLGCISFNSNVEKE